MRCVCVCGQDVFNSNLLLACLTRSHPVTLIIIIIIIIITTSVFVGRIWLRIYCQMNGSVLVVRLEKRTGSLTTQVHSRPLAYVVRNCFVWNGQRTQTIAENTTGGSALLLFQCCREMSFVSTESSGSVPCVVCPVFKLRNLYSPSPMHMYFILFV